MFTSKHFAALAILMSCCLAVSGQAGPVKKQSDPKPVRPGTVRTASEGVGVEGIIVGRSKMSDVAGKFGKDYKWTVHKKYSYSMSYPKLGLAFYICQSDPKKEIFDIEMRAPFQVRTARGIVLGKSTVDDIERIYGKSKDGLKYRGVNFYYAVFKGKRTVTVIDIVENSGIRQCKEKE
jgi:hypothetical protein